MLSRLFGSKPSDYAAHLTPAGIALRVGAKQTLLQAALDQGIAFPNSCRAGGCATCKCKLVKGKVKELTDKSYVLSAEELRENYILACQSVPLSDIDVDVQLDAAPSAPTFKTAGHIERMAPLTHDILHVVIALEQPLSFTPGQYAELVPSQGSAAGIARNYSFANVPDASGSTQRAEFFIRKVPGGQFTRWLFDEAQPGDRLQLRSPFGDFMLRPGSAPMLCIAGGSGLAPLLSLLQGALQTQRPPREVTLVFGARSARDLYMLDAIDALRREWPLRFDFVPILANEAADSPWQGRRGLIPNHLGDILGASMAQHEAYLCGPPGMIDDCVATLKSGGVADTAIHFDKFLDQSHTQPKALGLAA